MNPIRWLKDQYDDFVDLHLVEWAETLGLILGIMLLGVLGLGVEWLLDQMAGAHLPPVEP